MRGKLLFVAGAAVGYVLGARAGRKRYEQIKSAATKVWESPGIQKQVDSVEDFVAAKVGDVPGALYEGVKKLIVQASNRRQESTRPARSATPAPAPAAKAAIEESGSAASAAPTTTAKAARKPAAKSTDKPAAKSTAAKSTTAKSTSAKPAATKPSKPSGDADA
ncbi:hypothetical protein ACFVWR_02295 [Leifsonia sp. NPDC058292]|uniref:hypothetical protein n=1 Tax=Leifsonia sp. NPDC058292 TaxID=3346428 RepID=UPI0036DD1E94